MTRSKGRRVAVPLIIIIPLFSFAITTLVINIFVNEGDPGLAKSAKSANSALTIKDKAQDNYGLPVRLKIPKIGVDAAIEQMGLTAEGDMEAPKTNEDVGWYKHGARPGDTGSAVVAGHLGTDSRAVFGKLSSLEKSDVITVTDEHQQPILFVVTGTRRYANDAAPKEVFTSATGAHLNLITCDGAWNAARNTFSDRLVVFSDRLH